ncbi:tripartite tricarboxylate transporter TctB family protein [Bradyrhizobium sp. SRL28]|uniref:tripartite tricarboxylate transporter TctB family protein n=1 Tax=Bradyrhizobium sp. SRL28 TaxID=2836178 RepID=UPI001BDE9418|nr:tripartite tricarboxylate transporter TctB family protein [Bradyrhizobium sp. SRL28]MBT1509273.1 tripartite tricarboxylate transporter TctB family protein [Bradyrhizobium sp. SRL28]
MKNVTSRLTIRDRRAFVSGAFFLTVAVFFYAVALGYAPGTTARMGPGYFPRLLSIVLAAIGLFVMAGAMRPTAEMQRLRAWDLKGLLWVTGSVMLFAFLLYPLGFVISLFVLIMVSSKASPEFTLKGALANAAVLIVLCVGVFVYGLGLKFPVWPTLFN